ncbi:N-acetylmuramoyl-L-alanine amidase [Frigidibacter sp. RF13]|uniref:N-acetylmuramoyl-L-alanine amidase n=1 Tax=Frigidibacter sp. RF13 TaxID=2997340 RepID=UPI00226E7771|nr:N-acetylmuramoyl-L-alanine amidase [Frigidibacter sp. RF13]MCY1125687.1 N-acetylmuramoyl-L-alanine amidase [Frigidibacter sp. RF13]
MSAARGAKACVAIVNRALTRITVLLACFLALGATCLTAQTLSPLAELDLDRSVLKDEGQGVRIELALSQPVPYRVLYLDNPLRLVVEFQEVNFDGHPPAGLGRSDRIEELHWGRFRPGWSRLVALVDVPLALEQSEAVRGPDGTGRIHFIFRPTNSADYESRVADSAGTIRSETPTAQSAPEPITRQRGDRPLRVTLDPGHGGIDPGAEAGKEREAHLVLGFGLELAERLRRAGMEVELTRTEDQFVPLEKRISIARAARADIFLSLHADALEEGTATGATIYKLDAEASEEAAVRLAERHDRADILAGLDLSGQDDEVAGVLMDLARQETRPRADRLAESLAAALKAAGLKMHRHPIQGADFSVLKSADIPSLLLELGFLSSEKDRERMADPAWRTAMQEAIAAALADWAVADAAEAALIRQ